MWMILRRPRSSACLAERKVMRRGPLTAAGLAGKIPLRCLSAIVLLALASLFILAVFALNSGRKQAEIERSSGNGASVPPSRFAALSTFQAIVELNHRPLFPYSVIPGGVESVRELKSAAAHDPVIARHYANFNLAKARIVRLSKDRPVYVSYRLGNRIFWTRRKLQLLKGETVITDGEHAARTRCGNRISETPAGPVSSKEPPRETLETPLDPGLLMPPGGFPPSQPPAAKDPFDPGIAALAPLVVPILWGGGSPAGSTPNPPPPAPPPPVAIPEPGTLVLLSAGLSATLLLGMRKI